MDISDSQFFQKLETEELLDDLSGTISSNTDENTRLAGTTVPEKAISLSVKPLKARVFLGGVYDELPLYATEEHQQLSKEIFKEEKKLHELYGETDRTRYRTQILDSELELIQNEIQYYSKVEKAKSNQINQDNRHTNEIQETIAMYEQRIKETKSQAEAIKQQILRQTDISRTLEAKLQVLQKKGEKSRAEFERFEFQTQIIEHEIQNFSDIDSVENEALNSIPVKLGQINANVGNIRSNVYDNETEVIALNSMMRSYNEENAKLLITEREMFARWEKLSDRVRKHRQTLAEHIVEVKRLESEKTSNAVILNQLSTQLDTAKLTLKRAKRGLDLSVAKRSELVQENSSMDEAISNARLELKLLTESINEKNSEKSVLNTKITQMYQKIQAENRQFAVEKKSMEELKQTIAILKSDTQDQNAKIQRSNMILMGKRKELELLNKRVDSIQAKLAAENSKLVESEEMKFSLEQTISVMKRQRKALLQDIKEKKAEIDNLAFQAYEQRLKIGKLSERIAARLNGNVDTFVNKNLIAEQKEQLDFLREQAKKISSENKLVKAALSALDVSLSDLQEEVINLKNEHESILSKLSVLQNLVHQLNNEQKHTKRAILEKSLTESMLIFQVQKEYVRLKMIFSKSNEIAGKAQAYIELLKRQSYSHDEKILKLQNENRHVEEELQTIVKKNSVERTRLQGAETRLKNVLVSQYDHEHVNSDESWEDFDTRIKSDEERVMKELKARISVLKSLKKRTKVLEASKTRIQEQNTKMGNNLIALADQLKTKGHGNVLKAAGYVMDESGSLSISGLLTTLENAEKEAIESGRTETEELGPVSMTSQRKMLVENVAKAKNILKQRSLIMDRQMEMVNSQQNIVERLNEYLTKVEKEIRDEKELLSFQNIEFQNSNEKIVRAGKKLAEEIGKIGKIRDHTGGEASDLVIATWIQIVLFSICRLALWSDCWSTLEMIRRESTADYCQEIWKTRNGERLPWNLTIDTNVRAFVESICTNLGIDVSMIWAKVEQDYSSLYNLISECTQESRENCVTNTRKILNMGYESDENNSSTNQNQNPPPLAHSQGQSQNQNMNLTNQNGSIRTKVKSRASSRRSEKSRNRPLQISSIAVSSYDGLDPNRKNDLNEKVSSKRKNSRTYSIENSLGAEPAIQNRVIYPVTPHMIANQQTRSLGLVTDRGKNLLDTTIVTNSVKPSPRHEFGRVVPEIYNVEQVSMSSSDPLNVDYTRDGSTSRNGNVNDNSNHDSEMNNFTSSQNTESHYDETEGRNNLQNQPQKNITGARQSQNSFANHLKYNSSNKCIDDTASINTPSTFNSETSSMISQKSTNTQNSFVSEIPLLDEGSLNLQIVGNVQNNTQFTRPRSRSNRKVKKT